MTVFHTSRRGIYFDVRFDCIIGAKRIGHFKEFLKKARENVKPYTLRSIEFPDIDEIRPLWEELNASHAALSVHFSGHFSQMTFEKRKKEFALKSSKGALRTDGCMEPGGAELVGYCVSNIIDGIGEIDSLYVKPEHRRSGAGSLLVNAAMEWMHRRKARRITVNVAVGNEKAIAFYKRFGLLPRLIFLTDATH
jgi:ribosomal protein S18 acetylase RimI-like enzyme